jgi:hypothetical protein
VPDLDQADQVEGGDGFAYGGATDAEGLRQLPL